MKNELIRILDSLGLDDEVISPVAVLFETGDYQEALIKMIKSQRFNKECWKSTAQINRLIVIWRPETAHLWLDAINQYFGNPNNHIFLGLYHGTVIGLLEAGVWLEKNHMKSQFTESLLMGLAKIIRDFKVLSIARTEKPDNISTSELKRRMLESLEAFVVPVKVNYILFSQAGEKIASKIPEISESEMRKNRLCQARTALDYLKDSLVSVSLGYVSKLFVDRLIELVFDKLTLKEKISAIRNL